MPTQIGICLGHVRPDFTLWDGFRFATYENTDGNEHDTDWLIDVDHDLSPLLARPDTVIGEFHYLFGLRRQLERMPDLGRVFLCHYRRFVSNRRLGPQSSNQPWSEVLTAEEASTVEVAVLMPRRDSWLVTTPVSFEPDVTAQFAQFHNVRDWYRFLSDCCDSGTLSQDEVLRASQQKSLLPCPANGCFPAWALIEHLTRLEECALAFVEGGYQPYTGYQQRTVAFCLERLHSFLIVETLLACGIALEDVAGHQITVNDSLEIPNGTPIED